MSSDLAEKAATFPSALPDNFRKIGRVSKRTLRRNSQIYTGGGGGDLA